MKLRSPTPADYIHIAAWIPDAVALYESLGFRRDDSKLLHDSIFMRVARA